MEKRTNVKTNIFKDKLKVIVMIILENFKKIKCAFDSKQS
jgi:hypothetical protein